MFNTVHFLDLFVVAVLLACYSTRESDPYKNLLLEEKLMNKRNLALALLIIGSIMLFSVGISAQGEAIQSICLVTDIGRINDGTFNQFAYDGMQRAVEELGLEDTFIETQNPVDYETHINTCLDGGYDIIITVGFALGDATYTAADSNADVYFIGVDQDFSGVEPLPNIVGLQFREDQAGFLAGAMAALVTETDVIAGVYGLDIFPVIKFRHGFEQGAEYINPDITTLGVYIPDFQAPDQGQEAAIQFIGEGADVIFGAGGPTGSGGITYAAAEGYYVIGVDQDEYFTTFGGGESPGAEYLITSAMKRVDNGVYNMVVALISGDGFPANSTYVLEIANDGIDFAESHDSDISEDVIQQIVDIREGLREGSIVTGIHPVTGEFLPTTTEVLQAEGLTILALVIDAAGLSELANTGAPFTLFAPTDAAILAALDEMGVDPTTALADTEFLTAVVLNHVIEGAVLARNVVDMDMEMMTVETMGGGELSISLTDMGAMINDTASIVATDILTYNGVIHIIDTVLLPPEE